MPYVRRLAVKLAVPLGALALPACTVGPDYARPEVAVRSNFAELAAATQPSRAHARADPVAAWWGTFNDPRLSGLVERTVGGNLNLQRAASRIRQARAQLGVAGGALYPQVNAAGGYAHARGSENVSFPAGTFGARPAGTAGKAPPDPQTGAGTGGPVSSARAGGPQSPLGAGGLPGVTTDLYQVGLDASWELDLFGGTRRDVEAAAADLAASVEDRRDVLVSLAAEVANDYLNLRGLQQRLAIARENLATQQDTLELTRSRQRAGFVTELDVARAQALVAETVATLPALESQARQAVHALSVLAGEEPDALMAELSDAAGVLPAVPPDVPVGLPSELLRRRPDVRRAERQLAAATARVGVATADLYPKFSITGSLGLDSTKAKHLLDWGSRYFILSPGVSWPLLEGGRIRANISAQEEARTQALLTYRDAVLTALREVEDALAAYSAEQARHKALSDAVAANRSAVDLARQQYAQGVIDFLTVLDTQRQLLAAQDAQVQSARTIDTNLVALYKALGGGWEVETGPPPQATAGQ